MQMCHRLHRRSSMCLEASLFLPVCFLSACLPVVPVNELVTWISRLVPRYVLPADCFLPPSFASSNFSSSFGPCFLLSCPCLFTFTVDGNHRLRKMPPGTRPFSPFLRPFLPLLSSLKCRQSNMFGVSKLVSVLGVSGEQPRHNSRVEWAGERRGGKMNSMLWGFPNPNSLQGLCRLHCAEFTRI